MAARSTRAIHSWRWACLAALALLAGCASKEATSPGPAESMGAPAAGASAEPAATQPTSGAARPADEPATTAKLEEAGDDRSAAAPRAPGEDDTRLATAPPPNGTPAQPAPRPPGRPAPAVAGTSPPPPPPPERPGSPAGDTGQRPDELPGHSGAGRTQPRPRPTAPDVAPTVERTGDETVTRPAATDQDRPNQAHETQEATKNTEEASPSQEVEEFYASLPEQAIAFHVPRKLQRGEMFTVRLVVQPGQSEAALEAALVDIVTDAGPAPAPGDVRTRTTRIGDEMQASISSPTLQIVPRGEDRQLVRRSAVTEWAWYVTANAGGSHRLTLSLYAIPPGRSSGIKVKTFEETLTVEVTFIDEVKDTVADNWEWMWTFVLGPIGALAWRRRQRRHGQAA